MIDEGKFLELVDANHGFEVTLGFRNDVDHFIGGTGNKVWYFVQDGAKEDYYVCTLDGAGRTDVHFTRKRKVLTSKPAPSGKTLELILSRLLIGQDEIRESGRKPTEVDYHGHRCSHYSFMFGERAYKVSDEFGITVEYSNINDEAAGFSLRNIKVGEDVEAPKEG